MPREVKDGDGVTWSCIQAFSGLGESREKEEAAKVDGRRDRYHVVCTPSGGAKSVRVELPGDWETGLSDEALLKAIHSRQARDA
ncbi:hypothetical protein HPC49_21115 [Pyxidicoccus fallax]|uniref:Uncharacterized protein n=1 Tax=Pyxidicoccus fallax TaxID=394095 RepID=A0A848LEU5_9BACT|nr:hypothetical protein [Pyxidicoccus fallax]NMO15403.1 hypothetical protein [Pyxidicoccus fallax]NPC80715.1 hypothetical protein [Pyxidicoccus fallax]